MKRIVLISNVGAALLLAGILSAPAVQAERYFTWVDEQGQLRTTVIRDENPLEKRAEQARKEQMTPDAEATGAYPEQKAQAPRPSPMHSLTPTPTIVRTKPVAEPPAPEGKRSASVPVDQPETDPRVADPVFNLEQYPDADELEERGYIREGDASPFYTWTDATGTLQNTPFNPARERAIAKQKAAVAELAMAGTDGYSQAETLRRDSGLPAGAAANAAAVLGLRGQGGQPGLLEAFTRTCCEGVDKTAVHVLDPERSTSLRIKTDAPAHDFATGRSPYGIVELPTDQQLLSLRLRSFIDGGAFVPTLVFLDANWQPVRLVTDIEFSYQPESWYRYGYLQARVPVEPQKGERWMLVLSKGDDLSGPGFSGEIDARPHQSILPAAFGELELAIDNLSIGS